jgi:hypothetical protein
MSAEPKPVRIQRKRTKGYDMQAESQVINGRHCIFVGRPTRWGNPFDWRDGLEVGNEAWAKCVAVELFEDWLNHPENYPAKPAPPTKDEIWVMLRNFNLSCFCGKDERCHADVLLRIANREKP